MAVYNHQISEEQVVAFRVQLADLVEKSRMYAEETISRDAVSRLMLLNRTYFSTLLQLATGKSFRAYINDLRMQYVLELMADPTMSLNDIPCMVGYKNKTTYYRVFDQAFGCLPRVYRLAHFPEACAAMSETAATLSKNDAAISKNGAAMSKNGAKTPEADSAVSLTDSLTIAE